MEIAQTMNMQPALNAIRSPIPPQPAPHAIIATTLVVVTEIRA